MTCFARIAFVLSIVVAASRAQEAPGAATPKPRQDPEALALFDKADEKIYSAKRAGLKDLQYHETISTSPGLVIDVKWLAPDRTRVRLTAKEGAPKHVQDIARIGSTALEGQSKRMVAAMIGKENRETYAGDEVTLAGPNQVRVVARSDETTRLFRESLITFDGRGLPLQMRSMGETSTTDMEVVWEPQGDKVRLKEARLKLGEQAATMVLEYQEVAGFTFIKRIVIHAAPETNVREFSDIKVNQGLTEKDLE